MAATTTKRADVAAPKHMVARSAAGYQLAWQKPEIIFSGGHRLCTSPSKRSPMSKAKYQAATPAGMTINQRKLVIMGPNAVLSCRWPATYQKTP